ncbi:MAG TPA: D-2-hydroxyacid dehydrogenase family protein [Candidatus Dormibacteraeota bacterium]|nr:D-2-hydroxyacid dehydrogenase family protein [Candidatus Dormibacteraeota bacterium]
MIQLAVLDDYQRVAAHMADWPAIVPDAAVTFFADHLTDEDELAGRLAGFEAVVAMRERTPFRRSLLARLPRLRLLVTTGMRNAAIDLAAAGELGITVCGTAGSGTGTGELTWALILALLRHVPAEDASVRAGGWQHTIGADLAAATLGVLGLGNIGRRVAAVGLAFGMDVIAWSQNLTAEAAAAAGARRVEREELFRLADVLTIHLVLSDRTRGLVGPAELALMKPTAYLVNTSRGPIVDEAALAEHLRAGRIAGAGLDVFSVEPLPAGDPLRALPNTVLTPHLGYVTARAYRTFYREAAEDVAAFLAGRPVRVLTP